MGMLFVVYFLFLLSIDDDGGTQHVCVLRIAEPRGVWLLCVRKCSACAPAGAAGACMDGLARFIRCGTHYRRFYFSVLEGRVWYHFYIIFVLVVFLFGKGVVYHKHDDDVVSVLLL